MLTSHRSLFLVVVCNLVLASVPVVAQSVVATVGVGTNPGPSAVNTATNKTYVTNLGCTAWPCSNTGTVSVISGVTNDSITAAANHLTRPTPMLCGIRAFR